jgi:outer membrane protein insertion porin family
MGLARPLGRWLTLAGAFWALALWPSSAGAQATEPSPAVAPGANEAPSDSMPNLGPPPSLEGLAGLVLTRVEVVTLGGRWALPVTLRRVRPGDTLSPEVARRALQELVDSGRYSEVRAEADADGQGARLRLLVLPRRIVASVKITGGQLQDEDTRNAAGTDTSDEITAPGLLECAARVRAFYVKSGFPQANVAPDAIDTDDPMRVVVVLHVVPGPARLIASRVIRVYPAPSERLKTLLTGYAAGVGDRADEDALVRADHDEQDAVRKGGFHLADVRHHLEQSGAGEVLVVDVQAGPFFHVRFEGNRHFDESDLEDALDLEASDDRGPNTLASRLEKFYVERGFFDVRVTAEVRGRKSDVENDLVFRIREGESVHVALREYPCLTGNRGADEVGAEIDSFLSEALPGSSFIGTVDPEAIDAALGPRGTTGARVVPLQLNPWRTYVEEVYDRATKHLQELYRSEGYLSATVGPVVLMRRACDKRSPPGRCMPIGARVRPPVLCPVGNDLPVADDAPAQACVPDPKKGIRCEPEVALHIPVKLGPRAVLWDASFEGNRVLVEAELEKLAELDLGGPLSQVELEKARHRLLDEYQERGFAFATVELRVELSPDRTRARARFLVNERERVRVKDIIVRGAERTNEELILGRVAFARGDYYQRSRVRATEERLATLGVFSSVTVALEDPEVFAKEKVVVITVHERDPQYVATGAGVSTGDGLRVLFEYGQRNLAGQAIKFTARIQLGYLPDFLIFEPDVRQNFDKLATQDRLERRNTISLEFPEVGLGPLFPFGVDIVDVRDNSRDFGITKDAGIVTLSYRPTTRFVTQVGGSLELNNADIFADKKISDLVQENPALAARLRVPDGRTYAVAERTSVTWDRRDNPFDATQGTYASAGVEHVRAQPVDSSATTTSDFLRLTSRVAGYLRLSQKGLALALSFRWGYNLQLKPDSQTYPDRLFYFGGGDSMRGFLQDSVIPQDIATKILADEKASVVDPRQLLTADKVAIRGGNVLLNPRAELRIPLGGVFQTALFLDAGNLWLDPTKVDPWQLRYATGTGLRASTPVGPLALDIGFNLNRRAWEAPFAFHFSIGLF